jgi:hypothetical protein
MALLLAWMKIITPDGQSTWVRKEWVIITLPRFAVMQELQTKISD